MLRFCSVLPHRKNLECDQGCFGVALSLKEEGEKVDGVVLTLRWHALISLLFRDEEIQSKCGIDATTYLSFQRHILVMQTIICVLSVAVILPVNFSGNLMGKWHWILWVAWWAACLLSSALFNTGWQQLSFPCHTWRLPGTFYAQSSCCATELWLPPQLVGSFNVYKLWVDGCKFLPFTSLSQELGKPSSVGRASQIWITKSLKWDWYW